MVAALVLPEEVPDEGVNMRDYYERNSSWMFGFLMAIVLVSVVKELLLEGRLPVAVDLGFHILLIVTAIAAITVKRPGFHKALAVSGAVLVGVYIALLFSKLAA